MRGIENNWVTKWTYLTNEYLFMEGILFKSDVTVLL
jgi:hypothetical protein